MKLSQKSGIYLIKNLKNGKIYIGKANNINARMAVYRYDVKRPERGTSLIERSIRKYGWENFEVKILELVNENTSNDELLFRESLWIKFYDATNREKGYNLCKHSTDCTGIIVSNETKKKLSLSKQKEKHHLWGKHHTQETKDKMSKTRIEKGIGRGVNNPNFGKKFSEETLRKMSESQIKKNYRGVNSPNFGKSCSEETKKKIGLANKGRSAIWFKRPINQLDLEGNFIKRWESAKDAADFLNIVASNIRNACIKFIRKDGYVCDRASGFKWEYI